jgi:hypothetical protein
MTSALERLAGPGKPLTAEPADAKEFGKLKSAALARLKQQQPALTAGPAADLAH